MEFSEVRSREKEVRRTEHFSAAELRRIEGERGGVGGFSQESVCSVSQAYT